MTYSFYRESDGEFAGHRFMGPEQALEANTPAGHRAIAGEYGPDLWVFDLDAGMPVRRTPPRPQDTDEITWQLSEGGRRWLPSMTLLGRKRQAVAALQDQVKKIEGSADRAVRELVLATGSAPAAARMQAIEEAIAPLRARLAAINAAGSHEELDALGD